MKQTKVGKAEETSCPYKYLCPLLEMSEPNPQNFQENMELKLFRSSLRNAVADPADITDVRVKVRSLGLGLGLGFRR